MLYVRLEIKVKVGIPESVKVGWYPHKITGSSHLKLKYVYRRTSRGLGIVWLINWYGREGEERSKLSN